MMKKIVIASDSFKGSLSSARVADTLGCAFRTLDPDCSILGVQVADGGEGTVEAIASIKPVKRIEVTVSDPLGRPIRTSYALDEDGCALLEMSAASGLPLLRAEERNPEKASTFGTGEMILDALDRGCRKFVAGIGGSATNDAGTGMLQALGARFLDSEGRELNGCGAALRQIRGIDLSGLDSRLAECSFSVACDVDNPFCGPQGAAFVFAPQKGADSEMVEALDRGLENFAKVIEEQLGTDIRTLPGAGAAGGLGGAFTAFLKASLKPGVDVVLDSIGFDALIQGADLVITGEGKMDSQTASGKTPLGVLRRAQMQGIPVVAVAGCVQHCPSLDSLGFNEIYATAEPGVPLEKAITKEYTCARLRHIAAQILQEYQA